MEKIKAAVIGYGNIGRYVIELFKLLPISRSWVLCAGMPPMYRQNWTNTK